MGRFVLEVEIDPGCSQTGQFEFDEVRIGRAGEIRFDPVNGLGDKGTVFTVKREEGALAGPLPVLWFKFLH